MSNKAWVGECHLIDNQGVEYQCISAAWCDSIGAFRTLIEVASTARELRVLWLEEVLSVSDYVARHGQQAKIGKLARAVHSEHLVELSAIVPHHAGKADTSDDYLFIEALDEVVPLDDQFGQFPKKSTPPALEAPLFGQATPTDAEISLYGHAAAVPEMKTYAILDAAKVPHLTTHLRTSGLRYQCLFQGSAAHELKDVAPYLVELADGNTLTRNLFTSSGMPADMWDKEPGIYLRSRVGFDAIRKHFRKFTRIQDDNGNWFLFRFWEPSVCARYMAIARDHRKETVPGLFGNSAPWIVREILCLSGKKSSRICAADTAPSADVSTKADMTILRFLSLSIHAHEFARLYRGADVTAADKDTAVNAVTKYYKMGFKSRYHLGSFVNWTLALGRDFAQESHVIERALPARTEDPNIRFITISREMKSLHPNIIRNYRGRN